MPFPIDVTRLLAYAGTDQPQRVACVPFEGLRARLAADGLHEGDEITCLHDASGRTLVTTAHGREIVVDLKSGVVIEVTPATTSRPQRPWRALPRRRKQRAM